MLNIVRRLFPEPGDEQKLNTLHLYELEKTLSSGQFVDYSKLLKHTNNLLTQLTKVNQEVYNQSEFIRMKLLGKAKDNIAIQGLSITEHQTLLEKSIKWMGPIENKRKEVDNLMIENNNHILGRELSFGFLKATPLICAFSLTIVIDLSISVLENLIQYPTAHIIVLMFFFLLGKFFFDRLFEAWQRRIYKRQISKDLVLLINGYPCLEQAAIALKRAIEEEPNCAGLFE